MRKQGTSFSVLVGAAICSLVFVCAPEEAFGKSKKFGRFENHPVWQKVKRVDYPALGKDSLMDPQVRQAAPLVPDSALGKHWGLSQIGFFDVFTPLVQPAFTKLKSCSNKVVVAVIDTGIDYTHPELRGNLWRNQGEVGPWKPAPHEMNLTSCRDKSCNGLDDDANGFVDDVVGWDFVHNVPLPFDTHGHGTHIAGIVGSARGNGFGISGVCPNVSIMALKYYDNSVLGYNNLQNTVKAIEYAVKQGAHIINYSGGGSDPAPAEAAAVKAARRAGVLFVAASGNDGRNNDWMPYYPASYNLDNVISVGSLNQQKKLLSSSNYGKKTVDMAAPGLGILSTLPSGRFGTMSGTSQATAFVTGAAALLASQQPIEEFDYKKIKAWLEASAESIKGVKNTKSKMTAGALAVNAALRMQAKAIQKTDRKMAKKKSKKPAPSIASRKKKTRKR